MFRRSWQSPRESKQVLYYVRIVLKLPWKNISRRNLSWNILFKYYFSKNRLKFAWKYKVALVLGPPQQSAQSNLNFKLLLASVNSVRVRLSKWHLTWVIWNDNYGNLFSKSAHISAGRLLFYRQSDRSAILLW